MRTQPKIKVINHITKTRDVMTIQEAAVWQRKRGEINNMLQNVQGAAGDLVSSINHQGQVDTLRGDLQTLKRAVDAAIRAVG